MRGDRSELKKELLNKKEPELKDLEKSPPVPYCTKRESVLGRVLWAWLTSPYCRCEPASPVRTEGDGDGTE